MKYIHILLTLLIVENIQAQEVGLSFSYFVPRNGEFSTPISPFSYRDVGFSIKQNLIFETGVSLYRMSGMGMVGLPFETSRSLLGPNFTVFIPADMVLLLPLGRSQLNIKGGGFFFYGFDQRLNYGNIDRAIQQFHGWDVANATLTFENNPGWGFNTGITLVIPVTKQVNVSLQVNYLMGSARFPLKGSYTGGVLGGSNITAQADYDKSRVDFTGFEFTIGLMFGGNGGSSTSARPKKRR